MENVYKTIIIVDDNENDLSFQKNALRIQFNVFAVTSGKTLFLLLASVMPDLILLNADMYDGCEIIAALRLLEKTVNVPVILLTQTSSRKRLQNLCNENRADFLKKPLSRETLLESVEAHIKNEENNNKGGN